jgi:hypothetical protein
MLKDKMRLRPNEPGLDIDFRSWYDDIVAAVSPGMINDLSGPGDIQPRSALEQVVDRREGTTLQAVVGWRIIPVIHPLDPTPGGAWYQAPPLCFIPYWG